MNQLHVATDRYQRDRRANGEWGKASNHGLLAIGDRRVQPQPDPTVRNPAPHDLRIESERVPSPHGSADYRRALLAMRSRLQGNVVRTAEAVLSGDGPETRLDSPDTADSATEVVEQDLAISLLGSATITLDQIDMALARIEEGNYGHCLECDARIPAARLEAVPYATCCVQCAARQEQVA